MSEQKVNSAESTAPVPTADTIQAPTENGTVPNPTEIVKEPAISASAAGTEILDLNKEETPPIVRMRNSAAMNGQQANLNGHAAILRGLDALAETELSEDTQEIKKLDNALDHFNKYLDKFEKKNSELTDRLNTLLQSKKEERLKRRASFMQREEELKAENDSFESQLKNMFAKCAQMRRTSAPVVESGVQDLLEQSRRIRENAAQQSPIHENGHDEPAPAATN